MCSNFRLAKVEVVHSEGQPNIQQFYKWAFTTKNYKKVFKGKVIWFSLNLLPPEFAKSCAMRARVFYVLTCKRAKSVPTSHFYVPTCQYTCKRANLPRASEFFNLACQRAKRCANLFRKVYIMWILGTKLLSELQHSKT